MELRSLLAQVTTSAAADFNDLQALSRAVRAIQDQQAIRDLVTLYGRAVDDRDIDTLLTMFTADAVVDSRGTEFCGHEALRRFYLSGFRAYRTMLHTTHGLVVQLHEEKAASGWAHGHAELATSRTLVLVAYRYDDTYSRVDDRWLIARRLIRFMYAVPADEMASSFATPDRIRWPRTAPAPADYPEGSPMWEADGS